MLPFLLVFTLSPVQDPHAQMNQRGAHVMGFDLSQTTHHFLLYEDGGAIDVSVKDALDAKNREAIRSHLPHIAMLFGDGDFEAPMLVHDSKNVPGRSGFSVQGSGFSFRVLVQRSPFRNPEP